MVCFSESSSDYLNPIGHVCFKEKLGYFLVVKIQATEINVNTEYYCSLALSACHAAAHRCHFVLEHAVLWATKSSVSFGEFNRLRIQPPLPAVMGVWYQCRWNGLSLLLFEG